MDMRSAPRNRGCNSSVRLDLAQFTERFFALLGSRVQFNGPGACHSIWHSNLTSVEHRFAIDYLAEELFSKYDDGVPSPAKRQRAISRFREGEVLCSLTNCKFSPNEGGQAPAWLDPELQPVDDGLREESAVFIHARKVISKILGAFPGWDAVLANANFGPGSTTRLPRRLSHRSNKWAGSPHATPFLHTPLSSVFESLPLLKERLDGSGVEIYPGNNVDWVPKNYKTDRTIAIEPDWNMFLQKGVGKLIRRRLKRVKQNLSDQTVNRFLAAVGSIDGSLATLDMSMASDTVAYRLVETLIRPDWFAALEQLRSPVGFFKNDSQTNPPECEAVIFEKFSSMGNGYTFELESLIFYGLLRAVSELCGETDRRLYVYGDDIVVPTSMSQLAMTYLAKAGFLINPEKSFTSGPFRESCGGHYFRGHDVTPFYVREQVSSLDRLFLLHNNVVRWLNRHVGIADPAEIQEFLTWLRSHATPRWQRPRLTSHDVGDGAFIGKFDEVCPRSASSRKRKYWEGWRATVLQFRTVLEPHTVEAYCRETNTFRYFSEKEKRRRARYQTSKGGDLSSLWKLEASAPTLPSVLRGDPKFWVTTARKYLLAAAPRAAMPADVPQPEREWFVGSQVLPWTPDYSWF